MHSLHSTNEVLVGVKLSFQNLLQTRSTGRNNEKKNVWEKSNDAYSLSLKAMLHEAIFLATYNATMTNKKPFKLQRGCPTFYLARQRFLALSSREERATNLCLAGYTRWQRVSKLSTRTITNKMADAS